MAKNITNLEISSVIFSEVLKNNKLVLINEKIIEVANPFHNATTIRITRDFPNYEYQIQNGFIDPTIFYKNRGANFIYNGLAIPQLYEYIDRALINKCSINVGRTTNDFAEYYLNKEAYRMLKQHIMEEFKVKNIQEIDETHGDYKTFILSYRKK